METDEIWQRRRHAYGGSKRFPTERCSVSALHQQFCKEKKKTFNVFSLFFLISFFSLSGNIFRHWFLSWHRSFVSRVCRLLPAGLIVFLLLHLPSAIPGLPLRSASFLDIHKHNKSLDGTKIGAPNSRATSYCVCAITFTLRLSNFRQSFRFLFQVCTFTRTTGVYLDDVCIVYKHPTVHRQESITKRQPFPFGRSCDPRRLGNSKKFQSTRRRQDEERPAQRRQSKRKEGEDTINRPFLFSDPPIITSDFCV